MTLQVQWANMPEEVQNRLTPAPGGDELNQKWITPVTQKKIVIFVLVDLSHRDTEFVLRNCHCHDPSHMIPRVYRFLTLPTYFLPISPTNPRAPFTSPPPPPCSPH